MWVFVKDTIVVCIHVRIIYMAVIFVKEEIAEYVGQIGIEIDCIRDWYLVFRKAIAQVR